MIIGWIAGFSCVAERGSATGFYRNGEVIHDSKGTLLCTCFRDDARGRRRRGRWYFTPQAGGLWSDNDRGIEDKDWLYGLAVGKHLNQHWSLELNVNRAELDAPGASEVSFSAASIDVLRVFRAR